APQTPLANKPSYLTVTFRPQHVAEQPFLLTDDAAHALDPQPDGTPRSDPSTAPAAPPVDSAVAGGTQLVFIVPDDRLDPISTNPLHFHRSEEHTSELQSLTNLL